MLFCCCTNVGKLLMSKMLNVYTTYPHYLRSCIEKIVYKASRIIINQPVTVINYLNFFLNEINSPVETLEIIGALKLIFHQ